MRSSSSDCAQIVGALAQLVQQPGIFDGDHGLGGEALHQCDLLFGERTHLLAEDGGCMPTDLVFLQHRDRTRLRAFASSKVAMRARMP